MKAFKELLSVVAVLLLTGCIVWCIRLSKAGEKPNNRYEIYLFQDSITIKDGDRYVGAMHWDNTCKLDSLLLDDNQLYMNKNILQLIREMVEKLTLQIKELKERVKLLHKIFIRVRSSRPLSEDEIILNLH